jgi:polyhydroxybutyrate depolymerase
MKKTALLYRLLAGSFTLLLSGCGPELYDENTAIPADFNYEGSQKQCDSSLLTGKAGISNLLESRHEIGYHLRTPANYDAAYAHPLLVVFAPAGMSSRKNERFTGLTQKATQAGFIITYVDHQDLSLEILPHLGEIPDEIASQWCIDKERIYYTGHSDGGTVSTALAFLKETRGVAAAIAPSAAGMTGKDLAEQSCPPPLSVMVLHNRDDSHFPGYGKEAVSWWAACNQCDPEAQPTAIKDCIEYKSCTNGVRTLFCEKPGSHSAWPHLNDDMLNFLKEQHKQGANQ